jgi:hypothetical protein
VVMRRISALLALAGATMLTGCVQIVEPEPAWNQNVSAAEAAGALAGGALGGYLGAQFGAGSGMIAMTTLGITAGAAMGRELGRNLETANRPPAQQYVMLPYGHCLWPSNNGWSMTVC